MAATDITHKFVELKPTWVGKIAAGGVASAGATVVPASSVTGLTNGNVYYITVNRTDPTGTRKNATTARETFKGKLSGTEFIECVRGVEGVAQAWEADTVLEILVTAAGYNEIIEGIELEHEKTGRHIKASVADITTGTEENKLITPKILTDASNSYLSYPDGYLINGKIVPTVAGNNLTVAIKTLGGIDPSAASPVKVRINSDTYRTITSALSVTINAGTNWFNAGSAELATKEVDYFVYLCWNTTADPDGVSIMVSRIPYATLNSDFSETPTDDHHRVYNAAATATDSVVVIGRFAATLSAGAGYTWTVPTFTSKNLIQRPIYETRLLTWLPALSATGSMTATISGLQRAVYQIVNNRLYSEVAYTGSLGGSASYGMNHTLPMTHNSITNMPIGIGRLNYGDPVRTLQYALSSANQASLYMLDTSNYVATLFTMYGANGWYTI